MTDKDLDLLTQRLLTVKRLLSLDEKHITNTCFESFFTYYTESDNPLDLTFVFTFRMDGKLIKCTTRYIGENKIDAVALPDGLALDYFEGEEVLKYLLKETRNVGYAYDVARQRKHSWLDMNIDAMIEKFNATYTDFDFLRLRNKLIKTHVDEYAMIRTHSRGDELLEAMTLCRERCLCYGVAKEFMGANDLDKWKDDVLMKAETIKDMFRIQAELMGGE